jgi:hypothetical protein
MDHPRIAGMARGPALNLGMSGRPEMVEVGLLLSSNRIDALIALSRRMDRSVAQMLRGWIDDAIDAECLSEDWPCLNESPVQ